MRHKFPNRASYSAYYLEFKSQDLDFKSRDLEFQSRDLEFKRLLRNGPNRVSQKKTIDETNIISCGT